MEPGGVDLAGVRAVVTGATSGLGAAMAAALVDAGASVAISGRPGPRHRDAMARWAGTGDRVVGLPMDVRDATSVESAAAVITARWGGLDLVVNNAGIGMRSVNPAFLTRPQPFFEVSPDGFADVVATNLTGYFHVARAFAPLLVGQGRGAIVNISMNHATMRRAGFVPYGPSRAGTESLSAIMAEDLRPFGVDVNMLLPGGATATGMTPEHQSPPPDLLDPAVMGPPIVFLASPEAHGLTGERLVATGFAAWLDAFRAGRPAPTA